MRSVSSIVGASQRGPIVRSFANRNLQYDNDEDSAACQPEIKGLVGKVFVRLGP